MRTAGRRARWLAVSLAASCLAALAALAPIAAAEPGGLAPTPPMGWNDWYSSYCAVDAQLVEQTAQAMVANGMKAAGYQYVNIDDCWMLPSRDGAGHLVADPARFPGGIKAVADYVHGLGLKLGIYEDAGTTTCAHFPGSDGHESQDAADFAAWGVDYVKYDRCNIPFGDFPGQSEQQVQQTLYTRMSAALRATGRPIVFSMCNPDIGDDPWQWGAPIANLWRTTTDIEDNFGSMLVNFEGTVDHFAVAGPNAWNDPDMLQIGNGGSSALEYRAEFSLWAEMAAPLIASTDLARLSPAELAIYENRGVIAVDQDPLGAQGVPVSRANGLWVLAKRLSGGAASVLLFNSTNTAAAIGTRAAAAGLPAAAGYRLQNLWTGAVTETSGDIAAFVAPHGVEMFRVSRLSRRAARRLPPHTVLSLSAADPDLGLGQSTIVRETLSDEGGAPLKNLVLSLSAEPGWRVERLGTARLARLDGRRSFVVAFRVTAPRSGPPVAIGSLAAAASYDPHGGRRSRTATLGERVLAPVRRPWQAADITRYDAAFGASNNGLAISSRGLGVFLPPYSPATDSYAALYEHGKARRSSVAEVTVASDPAGSTSGGAGLIEREAMRAPRGSPAGVVLFVSSKATIVMAWNANGGRDVDSRFTLPGVFVMAPVRLRLVRDGSTYTGYYSKGRAGAWTPVDTVTVARAASAGDQDVGVFHASGLPTWTTTATFKDFRVR